jgi:hypothetical protein
MPRLLNIACCIYFGKSNVLTKSGFTITNWNPIVKKKKKTSHPKPLLVNGNLRFMHGWRSGHGDLMPFF